MGIMSLTQSLVIVAIALVVILGFACAYLRRMAVAWERVADTNDRDLERYEEDLEMRYGEVDIESVPGWQPAVPQGFDGNRLGAAEPDAE